MRFPHVHRPDPAAPCLRCAQGQPAGNRRRGEHRPGLRPPAGDRQPVPGAVHQARNPALRDQPPVPQLEAHPPGPARLRAQEPQPLPRPRAGPGGLHPVHRDLLRRHPRHRPQRAAGAAHCRGPARLCGQAHPVAGRGRPVPLRAGPVDVLRPRAGTGAECAAGGDVHRPGASPGAPHGHARGRTAPQAAGPSLRLPLAGAAGAHHPAAQLRVLARRGGPAALVREAVRRLLPRVARPAPAGGHLPCAHPQVSADPRRGAGGWRGPCRPGRALLPAQPHGDRPPVQGDPHEDGRRRHGRRGAHQLRREPQAALPVPHHGDPGAVPHPRGDPARDQPFARPAHPQAELRGDRAVLQHHLPPAQGQRAPLPAHQPAVHPGDRQRGVQAWQLAPGRGLSLGGGALRLPVRGRARRGRGLAAHRQPGPPDQHPRLAEPDRTGAQVVFHPVLRADHQLAPVRHLRARHRPVPARHHPAAQPPHRPDLQPGQAVHQAHAGVLQRDRRRG